MSKTVDDTVRALKLKATPKPGAVSIRVGTKKYVLPFEARTLNGDGFLFVHIPPAAGILQLTPDGAVLVEDTATAEKAVQAFRKPRGKRSRKADVSPEVPAELELGIKKIPAGYKPVFENGAIRLVKTRVRKK